MPYRILHVIQPVDGGAPAVAIAQVQSQQQAGHTVAMAAPTDGWLAQALAEAGVQAQIDSSTPIKDEAKSQNITAGKILIEPWNAVRSPIKNLRAEIIRLREIINHFQPDLIHAHSAKAGLITRLTVRGRIPTVFQPHAWSWEAVNGFMNRGAKWWERYAARWTHLVICCSTGEQLLGQLNRILAPMKVIYNGVDIGKFYCANSDQARHNARQALDIDDKTSLVICVGRLSTQKGQDILVEAWKAGLSHLSQAKLIFVGDGPELSHLSTSANDYPSITFVGNSNQVLLWYQTADVVAVPSRWEAMALVPLEAMAAKRCVVAADVTGIAESFPIHTQALVPPNSPDLLAEAIVNRLTNIQLRESEAEANYHHVCRHHPIELSQHAVMEAYEQLLNP